MLPLGINPDLPIFFPSQPCCLPFLFHDKLSRSFPAPNFLLPLLHTPATDPIAPSCWLGTSIVVFPGYLINSARDTLIDLPGEFWCNRRVFDRTTARQQFRGSTCPTCPTCPTGLRLRHLPFRYTPTEPSFSRAVPAQPESSTPGLAVALRHLSRFQHAE